MTTSRAAVTSSAYRVLLVDDNLDALELLADALTQVGHEVRTAADGVAALALLQEFVPEIAVLDIALPTMNGWELAVQIRAALGPSCPRLLALTGYGQPRDRLLSRDAGFETHLVKPVDLSTLMQHIRAAEPVTDLV